MFCLVNEERKLCDVMITSEKLKYTQNVFLLIRIQDANDHAHVWKKLIFTKPADAFANFSFLGERLRAPARMLIKTLIFKT